MALSERAKAILLGLAGSPEVQEEFLEQMGNTTTFEEEVNGNGNDGDIMALSLLIENDSVYDIEVTILGYRTDSNDDNDVLSMKRRACSLRKNSDDASIAGSVETVGTDVDTYGDHASTIDVDSSNAIVLITPPENTAASVIIQDLTYTAAMGGTPGNNISIEYVNTGIESQPLEVEVLDSAITVNLELDAGTNASLIVQDLTYTAVNAGVMGNDITIEYDNDGVSGAETVDVIGNDIIVHMDDTVITGSSADDILAAVQASIDASNLVSVEVSGTGATVQAAAVQTPLANGDGAEPVSTADEIKSAIEAKASASYYVTVDVSGSGSNVQNAAVAVNLADGISPEFTYKTRIKVTKLSV